MTSGTANSNQEPHACGLKTLSPGTVRSRRAAVTPGGASVSTRRGARRRIDGSPDGQQRNACQNQGAGNHDVERAIIGASRGCWLQRRCRYREETGDGHHGCQRPPGKPTLRVEPDGDEDPSHARVGHGTAARLRAISTATAATDAKKRMPVPSRIVVGCHSVTRLVTSAFEDNPMA